MARRRRSEVVRRLAGPLVILLVAAVIAVFVWDRQQAQTAEVEQFVEGMCRRVALGENLAWSLSASEPVVARSVSVALESLFGGRELDPSEWRVEVVAGDVSAMADGTATHTASILVHDTPMIGLRLAVGPAGRGAPSASGDTSIRVLGYWLE